MQAVAVSGKCKLDDARDKDGHIMNATMMNKYRLPPLVAHLEHLNGVYSHVEKQTSRQNANAGFGVFTRQDIEKGAIIGEMRGLDRYFTQHEYKAISPQDSSFFYLMDGKKRNGYGKKMPVMMDLKWRDGQQRLWVLDCNRSHHMSNVLSYINAYNYNTSDAEQTEVNVELVEYDGGTDSTGRPASRPIKVVALTHIHANTELILDYGDEFFTNERQRYRKRYNIPQAVDDEILMEHVDETSPKYTEHLISSKWHVGTVRSLQTESNPFIQSNYEHGVRMHDWHDIHKNFNLLSVKPSHNWSPDMIVSESETMFGCIFKRLEMGTVNMDFQWLTKVQMNTYIQGQQDQIDHIFGHWEMLQQSGVFEQSRQSSVVCLAPKSHLGNQLKVRLQIDDGLFHELLTKPQPNKRPALERPNKKAKVQTVFLVTAMSSWHEEIWLTWVNIIQNPSVHFIVHYKSDLADIANPSSNDNNVTNYFNQVYNEWSHLIDLQFFMMHCALMQFEFEHCVFISGTCVPICPFPHMLSHLKHADGVSFLQHHQIPKSQVICTRVPKPKMFEAPNWFILCYSHVKYLLRDVSSVPHSKVEKYAYNTCYTELSGVTIRIPIDPKKGTLPPNIDEYGICTILAQLFPMEIKNTPVTDYISIDGQPHPLCFTETHMPFFQHFVRNTDFVEETSSWIWKPLPNWPCRFFGRKVSESFASDALKFLKQHWKDPDQREPATASTVPHAQGGHAQGEQVLNADDWNEKLNDGRALKDTGKASQARKPNMCIINRCAAINGRTFQQLQDQEFTYTTNQGVSKPYTKVDLRYDLAAGYLMYDHATGDQATGLGGSGGTGSRRVYTIAELLRQPAPPASGSIGLRGPIDDTDHTPQPTSSHKASKRRIEDPDPSERIAKQKQADEDHQIAMSIQQQFDEELAKELEREGFGKITQHMQRSHTSHGPAHIQRAKQLLSEKNMYPNAK